MQQTICTLKMVKKIGRGTVSFSAMLVTVGVTNIALVRELHCVSVQANVSQLAHVLLAFNQALTLCCTFGSSGTNCFFCAAVCCWQKSRRRRGSFCFVFLVRFGGRRHTISVLHRGMLNGSMLFGTQLGLCP